jgi:hypothetical protein
MTLLTALALPAAALPCVAMTHRRLSGGTVTRLRTLKVTLAPDNAGPQHEQTYSISVFVTASIVMRTVRRHGLAGGGALSDERAASAPGGQPVPPPIRSVARSRRGTVGVRGCTAFLVSLHATDDHVLSRNHHRCPGGESPQDRHQPRGRKVRLGSAPGSGGDVPYRRSVSGGNRVMVARAHRGKESEQTSTLKEHT